MAAATIPFNKTNGILNIVPTDSNDINSIGGQISLPHVLTDKGDMAFLNEDGILERIPIGTEGQVLTAVEIVPGVLCPRYTSGILTPHTILTEGVLLNSDEWPDLTTPGSIFNTANSFGTTGNSTQILEGGDGFDQATGSFKCGTAAVYQVTYHFTYTNRNGTNPCAGERYLDLTVNDGTTDTTLRSTTVQPTSDATIVNVISLTDMIVTLKDGYSIFPRFGSEQENVFAVGSTVNTSGYSGYISIQRLRLL